MKKLKSNSIHKALQSGDLPKLKKWVASGYKFENTMYDLTSGDNEALLVAVAHEQFDTVKWLVTECNQKAIPNHPWLEKEIAKLHGILDFDRDSMAVPEAMNAIHLALLYSDFVIAEWLLQNPSNNLSDSDISEMLLLSAYSYESKQSHLNSFIVFFEYAKLRIGLEKCNIFTQVSSEADFEIIKWMITSSGLAIDLSKNNFQPVMNILTGEGTATSTAAEWLVKKSGQIIDCRDCQHWVSAQGDTFEFLHPYDSEYLLSVKEIQDAIGLVKWAELNQVNEVLTAKKSAAKQKWKL